jgi:O-succinylbenzoate synthase
MIERIEVRIIHLPLVEHFETSFGRIYGREIIILIFEDSGIMAFSECATDKEPLYSYEDNKTALHIIEDYLIPMVLKMGAEEPINFKERSEFIKGHNMAKAAVELGLWDLKAKKVGKPLYELWGGVKDRVIAGVSIGIKDDINELLVIIGKRLDQGYSRIKLKIKPGKDVDVIDKVRQIYPNILLSVDCNSSYNYSDIHVFEELDNYRLLMIEQPFAHDDLYFHSLLQSQINTDICLDESINNKNRMIEALKLKSCRIVNIKLGRVGGYVEAKSIHDICLKNKIPVWCGGMLESGIGRAFNVALATLPNFILPNDISETRRYWDRDVIDYEFKIKDKYIEVPKGVGIGVKIDFDYLNKCTIFKKEYTRGDFK